MSTASARTTSVVPAAPQLLRFARVDHSRIETVPGWGEHLRAKFARRDLVALSKGSHRVAASRLF